MTIKEPIFNTETDQFLEERWVEIYYRDELCARVVRWPDPLYTVGVSATFVKPIVRSFAVTNVTTAKQIAQFLLSASKPTWHYQCATLIVSEAIMDAFGGIINFGDYGMKVMMRKDYQELLRLAML